MDGERCETCRYWTRGSNDYDGTGEPDSEGECRRYPPVYVGDRHGDIAAGPDQFDFPQTEDRDWCGEYRPRTPLPVVPAATTAVDHHAPGFAAWWDSDATRRWRAATAGMDVDAAVAMAAWMAAIENRPA